MDGGLTGSFNNDCSCALLSNSPGRFKSTSSTFDHASVSVNCVSGGVIAFFVFITSAASRIRSKCDLGIEVTSLNYKIKHVKNSQTIDTHTTAQSTLLSHLVNVGMGESVENEWILGMSFWSTCTTSLIR